MNATYHFTFTGSEKRQATVITSNKTLQIQDGHVGKPDISIIADSQTWLKILAHRQPVILALIRRKLHIKGSPKLLQAFSRCFV